MDITTVAKNLLELLADEHLSLSDDLTVIEPIVRDAAMRIGAKAVELRLEQQTLGYEGSSRACHNPDCGHDQKFVAHRPRTLGTVKERETLLWEGKYQQLLQKLEEERRRTRSVPKHQAIRQLITYLTNQGQRIAYDRFRAAGCDIGSGRVESACKHVVANRMKRSGMIWSDDGAQDLLSLRTAYLNGEWNQIWQEKPLLKNAA